MKAWHTISQTVLGKAMLEKAALSEVLRHCEPKDFPARYRAIFVAIRNCALEGRPVDVAVLCDAYPELKETVLDLAVGEFSAADQGYWIQRLLECEQESRMTEAIGTIQDALLKDQRPFGVKRADILRTFQEATTVKDAARLIQLGNGRRTEDAAFGPFTGFAPYDEIVGGLGEGKIHVLAGRPGRGKTTLAIQICRSASCPSVIVPLEMGPNRTELIANKQGEIPEGKIYMLDTTEIVWARLRFDVAWAVQASGARLVVVDHLGYLKLPAAKHQNRAGEVGDILKAIKQLMRELKASALIVCQLNRAVEGRNSEKPTLADLRESGEIEQESDTVSFLWCKRGEEYKPDAKCCLTVAKNRDGSVGGREIMFNKPERQFEVLVRKGDE